MFAYNAQPVNFGNNENNIEKKKKNKTIKNKKVKAILQHIEPFDNNNNNELGEFKPPPKPISMGVENTINHENNNQVTDNETDDETDNYKAINNEINDNEINDNEINVENYKALNSQNEHLYNNDKYVPYYTNLSNNPTINNELVKKLNYMIHLLEENKNIETESVSEDVILYSFLGVFIIFVIDSFSRANKYIR